MSSRRPLRNQWWRLSQFIVFITVSFVVGCVEPYSPSIITEDYGILVVDGFFVGNDSSFFRLSRTQQLESSVTSKPELRARIVVEGENGSSYEFKELGNGKYGLAPQSLNASVNYKIRIRTDDTHEYESDYVPMQQGHEIDSVTYEDLEADNRVEFSVYAHDPSNQTKYYYFTYDETWKYKSLGISVYRWENGQMIPRTDATEIQYCYKTQYMQDYFLANTAALSDAVVYDFKLFTLSKSSQKLYFGYSILVKQFALTAESYSYYQLTKTNSNNLGTLFDPIPTQPTSNIRCITKPSEPVIGFFNASYMKEKRLYFRRVDITPSNVLFDETGYELCPSYIAALDELSDETFQGMIIGDRVFDRITFELIGYSYSTEECMDCRKRGGVTTKPDYWYE